MILFLMTLFLIIIITIVIIVYIAILFQTKSCLLFPLHASFGELLLALRQSGASP
jgi:hypothetical protein